MGEEKQRCIKLQGECEIVMLQNSRQKDRNCEVALREAIQSIYTSLRELRRSPIITINLFMFHN